MPGEFADAIQRAIDNQLEIERKAAAWDQLMVELRAEVYPSMPIGMALFRLIQTKFETIAWNPP